MIKVLFIWTVAVRGFRPLFFSKAMPPTDAVAIERRFEPRAQADYNEAPNLPTRQPWMDAFFKNLNWKVIEQRFEALQ